MIGNNACGSRSLRYGRTADNVLALDVLTGTGSASPPGEAAGRAAAGRAVPDADRRRRAPGRLRAVAGGGLATIRTEFGRFGRQVSGYALEHLLPERGFDVAGSWSAARARWR